MVNGLFIAHVCNGLLSFLGSRHTEHIQGSVIFGLGHFIILLVFTLWLHFGHVHVMNKFGIILQAAVPNLFAFIFLVRFLVLVLETKQKTSLSTLEIQNIQLITLRHWNSNKIHFQPFTEVSKFIPAFQISFHSLLQMAHQTLTWPNEAAWEEPSICTVHECQTSRCTGLHTYRSVQMAAKNTA